jgi:hypothetical protein
MSLYLEKGSQFKVCCILAKVAQLGGGSPTLIGHVWQPGSPVPSSISACG